MTNKPKNNKKASVLIVSLGIIAAALLVGITFLIWPNFLKGDTGPTGETTQTSSDTQQSTSLADDDTILQGVTVGGVDVSGMTAEEALSATAGIPDDLLGKIKIWVNVDGQSNKFAADDFEIDTDYDEVITQAILFGHTGTDEERQQAAELASSKGVDFAVHATASKIKIMLGLIPLKEKYDQAPVDASCVFMPWGYTADGQAYEPDARKIADAYSVGKAIDRPELVRIDSADMPSPLRYLFWNETRYTDGYIPADANISRFVYNPEASGLSLEIDPLADQILAQVESGLFGSITVARQIVEPQLKLSDLKKSTQLISSWTSSYREHYSANRNWNVSRMSSFINGSVIQPGQEWTINTTAGYRTPATAKIIGWKPAAGIENGGYTQQLGGGTCQLGSTTFNAAIRAGITVVSATHHTIPSGYIPLGLDATISTPSPDLILKNDNTMPVYLVSYVNPKDRNVTVEVYGQQPVDPEYGEVIYHFTSDNQGTRFGSPTMKVIYNATVARDGTVLSAENPVYVYAVARRGTEIQTYKHIYSLDGTALCDPIPYARHKYPMINGTTYVFGPDPATVTPAPTESVPTETAQSTESSTDTTEATSAEPTVGP